jgi:type VI protein secretion system component VasK
VYRRTTVPGWEDSLPEHLRNAREEAAMESWVDRQGDRADLQDDDPAAYAADDRY